MPAPDARSSTRARFALLCGSTFFHFLAMGVLLVALPLFVSRELQQSRAVVGLAVGSFAVAAVLLRPTAGRQVDALGRRRFMIGAPLVVLVTAVGLLAAQALWAVALLRLIQGAAGAAFYTAAATVATDLADPAKRAERIARFSMFLYAGFAVGPSLGEWLVGRYGFAGAWWAVAGCAASASALGATLPETRPTRRDDAPRPPAHTGWRRAVHPAAVGPGLILITTAVGYTAISTFSPLYARSIGMGSSGTLYLCFAVTVIGARLFSGTLADRYGRVAVALPGLLSATAGLTLLAVVPRPAAASVGVALFGAGFALVFPSLMALTVDRVTDEERGAALGSYTAFFDVGAAGGGYLVGALADTLGYPVAWGVPAALCALGAVGLVRREARSPAVTSGPRTRRCRSPPGPDEHAAEG